MTEWELYESITCKSTLVKVLEDKQSILLSAQSYITYDPTSKKFLAITLDQAFRNVAVYDDPASLLPRSREAPSADVDPTSFKSFVAQAFGVLAWANQSRFQMPWRWSHWSNTYAKVLAHVESGRSFVWDPVKSAGAEEEKDPEAEEEEESPQERTAKNVKRLKKRYQQARERETV